MVRLILAAALFLSIATISFGQNDFRTRQSGPWSTSSTWEEFVAGSWQLTANTPTSTSGVITILSPHAVTVSQNVTIDQLIVASGGTLSINIGVVVTVSNGSGVDVTNSGTITTTAETQLVFSQNTVYQHARTGGAIPLAVWDTNSDCQVTGVTSTVPTGLSPSGGFYHFTWNSAGQSTTIRFNGTLTDVRGNLTFTTTNDQVIQLSTTSAPLPIDVDGNFNILGTAKVSFTTSATITVNVGGNFNFESTNAGGSILKSSGVITLNIGGDFIVNAPGGLLNFASGVNATTVNLTGNFNLINGTLTETSSGSGTFNFVRNGTQSFSNTGTIQNTFNYVIEPTAILSVLGESPLMGAGTLTVSGGLRVGSLNSTGAVVTGTTLGNVRVATRTYNTGSRVIYAGVAAQFIGIGHPAVAGIITEIDNPAGVTFDTNTSGNSGANNLLLADNLLLTQGNLNIVSNASIARSLTLAGTVTANGNAIAPSGTRTSLIINGSGAFGIFPLPPGPQSIQNFTMARTGGSMEFNSDLSITGTATLTTGNVEVSGPTTIFGLLTLDNGTTLFFDDASLTLRSNFVTTGGFLSGNSGATLVLSGSTAVTTPLTFSPTGNTLNTLVIDKSSSGASATVNSTLNITNLLTLTNGRLDIIGSSLQMAPGSTISRSSSAVISTSSPGGGLWNVIYTGGTQTTSLEIPASGNILNLALNVDNGSTVTLSQNLTASNGFTNNSPGGTFTCGSQNVTLGSFYNIGTFTAPNSTAPTGLTVNGNFTNDGTYNNSTGIIIIGGPVSMSGATINTTSFYSMVVNGSGTLTSPAVLNVLANFTNNGSFVAGTGSAQFNGTGGTRILSGSSNTQFYNLTLNKTNAGVSLSVNSPQTVTNSLTLTDGQLAIVSGNLIMTSGSTLSRSNLASISGTSPSGGPWNLVYTNNGLTTGPEIPSNFTVQSLTVNSNSSAVVTLGKDLISLGAITVNAAAVGPTFTSGLRNITTVSLTNNATFNAPTTGRNLTISGNFLNNATFNALAGNLLLGGNLTNNGTFNAGTSTTSFTGASNVLGSSTTTFNHVIISASGTLNGTASFALIGNFTNNGALAQGTGTISFTGTAIQNISGVVTDFNNINVTNTVNPSVRVQSNQNLRGTLSLGAGSIFDADGSSNTSVFTVLSTDDAPLQDGRIATLPAGASVTGNVRVQRFMIPATNDDRFFSSPVTNATVAQLQQSFSVTGNFTGTSYHCDGCAGNVTNLWYYVETQTGAFAKGYTATPAVGGSNAEALVAGRGYDVFMWNNPAPVTINFQGPVNQGPVNFTVTRTNSVPPVASADGWNLVGNPYPSAIQWNGGAGWSRNLIDPTVYVWDRLTNSYRTYNHNTASGTLTNGIIATGQAFWVYASAGAPSMSINEQAKIAPNINSGYYRERSNPEPGALKISLTDGHSTDESLIFKDEKATSGFDFGLDAHKLMLGKNLMLVAPLDLNNQPMAHLAIQENFSEDIPLFIKTDESGKYKFEFFAENFEEYNEWYLVDRALNISVSISSQPVYEFKPSSGNDNRFFLSKTASTSLVDNNERSLRVVAYPNPTTGTLNVEINSDKVEEALLLDNLGKSLNLIPVITEKGVSTGSLDLNNSPGGVYFVKIRAEGKVVIEKIIKY